MFKRTVKSVSLAALTLAFVVFAVVNRETVRLSLFPLPYSAEMPQFLFAILCFALGIGIAWIMLARKLSQCKRLLRDEHQRVKALQNEISTLHMQKQPFPTALPTP